MGYAIMRAEKVKIASDVKGREIHNERLKDHSNSNPDIDFTRTKDNYSIGVYDDRSYNQRIEQQISERYSGKKAIRKDATRAIEFLFTSDKKFFDKLSPEKQKDFFKDCYGFVEDTFGGKANIIGDKVHMDEETPHMHLMIVPLTADGRLSAKEFLGGKKDLQDLQDKFYEKVGKKWGLERGSRADLEKGESGKRHKTTQEIKAETKAAEIENKITEARGELNKILKEGKEINDELKKLKPKKTSMSKGTTWIENLNPSPVLGKVKISQADFNELKEKYLSGLYAHTDLEIERKLHAETTEELQKAKEWKQKYYAFKEEHKDDLSTIDSLEKRLDLQMKKNAEKDRKIEKLQEIQNRILDFISERSPEIFANLLDMIRPKSDRSRDDISL